MNLFFKVVFGGYLSLLFTLISCEIKHTGNYKDWHTAKELKGSSNFHPQEYYVANRTLQAKWLVKAILPAYVYDFLQHEVIESDEIGEEFVNRLLEGVDSDNCKGHIVEWLLRFSQKHGMKAVTEEDKWAAHMVDSWGKIPEGILTGHVSSYGDFDECVQAEASNIELLSDRFPSVSKNFRGSYCSFYIFDYGSAMVAAGRTPIEVEGEVDSNFEARNTSAGIGIRSALSVEDFLDVIITQFEKMNIIMMLPSISTCMPNSCSQLEIQNILVNAANMTYSLFAPPEIITLLPWPIISQCTEHEKVDLDAAAIVMIVILSLLLLLTVSAGIVDYWFNHGVEKPPPEGGLVYKYWMAFSFYLNTKKWLSTRKSADDLGCLHGIRFLSTAWVVLAHTYSIYVFSPQWNLWEVKNLWKNWTVLGVINGSFSVDTFFVMSGLLATYSILKLLDRTKGKFNVPMFYIHRIVRITPTYAILVGIASTLIAYLGSGPLWHTMKDAENVCRSNWWTNLLYINNIHRADAVCNGESWYLANDMQFYILSPVIVYPIWRWRKPGLMLLSVYTMLSIMSPILISNYFPAPPAVVISQTIDVLMNAVEIYNRPWARIQTFLVGVWLGWLLHITRGKRITLPPLVVAIGWLASTGLALTVIFAIHPWYNPENDIPKAAGLFYAGLSRFTFGIAVSWVIFACVKGYGGPVNAFLSWKVFMPLGRLCFCVYLISSQLQHIFFMRLKVPLRYDTYTMVQTYFAHMVSSYLVGFVATILFESPFIVLQKLVFEGN